MGIAAFIDLQGTLGGSGTDDIRTLDLYPFSIPAIKTLNENMVLVIGITNQSHISKNELTWSEYYEKLALLKSQLAKQGAYFDAVYCCPHTKSDNCECKKPLTGLVKQVCRDFDIDLYNSYVIGDMGMFDMLLAKNIGAKGILVLTGVGIGSLNEYRHTWGNYEPYYIAKNVLEAANKIVKDIDVI